MIEKALLRESMGRRRAGVSASWVAEASRAVAGFVEALPAFEAATAVGLYVALPGEVDTGPLMDRCWAAGRRVCVPAWRGGGGDYAMAWAGPHEEWRVGRFGVREPARASWAAWDDLDVILVPGVAFDGEGGRLGHGRGYYDRMLGGRPAGRPLRIALAFHFQVVERVPMGPDDVRMDILVTERGAMNTSGAHGAPEGKAKTTCR